MKYLFIIHLSIVSLLLTVSHAICSAEEITKFKVGFILPLTGTAADYGISIRNSMELARTDKPELFSNISFIYEDAIYDPKLAITAFNKLVDLDDIKLAIIWGVSFCKAVAPIAERREIPLVGLCIDPITAANKKYVLRFMNATDDFLKINVDYLLEKNQKNIGILLGDHPYQEEMFEALKRTAHADQKITIIDRLPTSEFNFRSQIIKIKNSNYDAIGVFLYFAQISAFYKQMKQLKLDLPTFGTNIFESLSEVKASAGTMNDAVFSNIIVNDNFLSRYKKTYGNTSTLSFGAPAYELALTIGELFNDLKTSLAHEIINKFSTVNSRQGIASGPYYYVNDPKIGQYFKFPVGMKKIVNEEFVNIK